MKKIEGKAGIFMGLLLFLLIWLLSRVLGVILVGCMVHFVVRDELYQRNNEFISEIFNISAKSGLYQRKLKFISERW
ncbi:hypothetical protein ACIGEL_07625 [Rossellomorea aquimaris]|uniref:hypothetical protein n=1 Tax=Rossellomorea aquimaris TaxID=189382 RepID=UPI0037CABBF6